MIKKRGIIIVGIIILALSFLNVFLYVNKGETSYNTISGKFIEEIPELPMGLNISLIAFIAQWAILILIIIVTFAHYLKKRKHENIKISHAQLTQKRSKSETELDILYNLLKDKKTLNTKTIARVFGIDKEKALEWAKILENYSLVTIEYPTFNDPEVRINEKEDENKKEINKKQKPEEKDNKKESNSKEDNKEENKIQEKSKKGKVPTKQNKKINKSKRRK